MYEADYTHHDSLTSKNEIKEIIDKLKDGNWYDELDLTGEIWIELRWKETHLLLDYITNLQQENERLKEILKWKQNRESELFTIESVLETNKQLYDERNIYRLRCEKAIEKMQYIIDYGFDYDGFNTVESLKGLIDMLVDYAKESKNILQKGSEDNEKN